jgi:cell wall-associated NlpC family hydrolase
MKYYNCIFLFIFFNGISVFSQEKYTRHTVSKGETISEIAKEYDVKSSEIYELNPDARNGIKLKSVLLIPIKAKKNTVSTPATVILNPEKTHEVLAKETLYGIAKQYNITIKDLYKINPNIEKEGLKKGQIIKITQTDLDNLAINTKPEKTIEIQKTADPQKEATNKDVVVLSITERKIEVPTEGIIHEVLPKETLYAIAKQYKITLADLQKANATLGTQPLKAGQKISIPVKSDAHSDLSLEERESKTEKDPSSNNYRDEQEKKIVVLSPVEVANKTAETEITHEVLPKETKYGIAKEYGITIAELEKQNPSIAKKLLVGSLLKIRSSKVMEIKSPVVETVVVKEESKNKDFVADTNKNFDAAFVDQLILRASENIGTRYRSGGNTKEGFDCSGLMCYTFSSYDIKLPRSSVEMASYGLKIDAQNAQKGDLIFFKTRGSGRINHVGMVVEVLDGEIKFIHSATHGGVIISSTKESYYERNLVQVNRVL